MSYLTCVVPEPIHVRFRRLSLEGSFSLASLPKFVVPLAPRRGGGGGGALGYFLGGYVPPETPIGSPFQLAPRWAAQTRIGNVWEYPLPRALLPLLFPIRSLLTADISRGHRWFPRKRTSEKRRRNSILMTGPQPDLSSACDWLKQISH